MPKLATDPSNSPDVLIVGAGLAGCCLAWRCWQRNLSVLLVDSSDPRQSTTNPPEHSSSAIAAGLVTPIQGQRFATPENYREDFEAISKFYSDVDRECNSNAWISQPSVRVIQSEERKERFQKRCVNSADTPRAIAPHARVLTRENAPKAWSSSFGAFEMSMAARLRIGEFRAATIDHAESRGCWINAPVSINELSPKQNGIEIPTLGITPSRVVLCTGIRINETSWTNRLQARYAGGEVLILELRNATPESLATLQRYSAIHHHGWCILLREADDHIPLVNADDLSSTLSLGDIRNAAENRNNPIVMFGATYRDGTVLDSPTAEGISELKERFQKAYRGEFHLHAAAAATRPVISGRKPIFFWSGDNGRLGFLGGLASHGVRTAPLVAEQLLNIMP